MLETFSLGYVSIFDQIPSDRFATYLDITLVLVYVLYVCELLLLLLPILLQLAIACTRTPLLLALEHLMQSGGDLRGDRFYVV